LLQLWVDEQGCAKEKNPDRLGEILEEDA